MPSSRLTARARLRRDFIHKYGVNPKQLVQAAIDAKVDGSDA